MLIIDGSRGEGGGQILRTSVAMSLLTGRAIRIENIRGKRKKPGLLRQHLTAMRAAAEVGCGQLVGGELGSSTVELRPGHLRGGEFHFSIGTAGSATLVLQTILPALLRADGPSRVVIEGGTHNMAAPPFPFIEQAFLPLLRRMGAQVTAALERYGFYPAGGGRIVVDVTPGPLAPLELMERGEIHTREATILVANLPRHVADRERETLLAALGWTPRQVRVEAVESRGPGNAVLVALGSDAVTEVFTGVGRRGHRAEAIVGELAAEVLGHLASGAPVGPHLADQLILPLVMAGGGRFRTTAPTLHTRTQVETVGLFSAVPVGLEPDAEGRTWTLTVGQGASSAAGA